MPRSEAPQITFEPANAVQDEFMWNSKRESMFDGGIGNGKTTGGIMRLLILAREYPKSQWVIARQTYKDLTATTKKTFSKVCPSSWIKRDVKDSTTLQNGAEIFWMHLDEVSDSGMRGLEINGAFISQAEEIAPEMWEFLDGRIGRWSQPDWPQPCPPYIWGDCNPNGHDWIYFRFHPEVVGEHPYRAYFFGETGINKAMLDKVSPGYYDNLMRKPDAWKRRWVYGSREIFEGAIHPDFRKEIHVYNADTWDPFKETSIKSCWGWFDYGLSAPTCMLLSASTSNNFHFITHEYYRRSLPGRVITIRDHASELLRIMRENAYSVRGVFADPSIFYESTKDRRTQTTSVAQEYREAGLYFARADNNEVSSIANLQELLHVDPRLKNPLTGKMGSPRLFISSRCTNLIEQIQTQKHAQVRNPLTGDNEFCEERALGVPDHAYDPLRYFANSSVWQQAVTRDQPQTPQYRTGPVTEKAVKGYVGSNLGPRPQAYQWRRLDRMPTPPRQS